MTATYRYACFNRPPGYATVPNGFVAITPPAGHPIARHGEVHYDRELAQTEAENYELQRLHDPEADGQLYVVIERQVLEPDGTWADERQAQEQPFGIGLPLSLATALRDRLTAKCVANGYGPDDVSHVIQPIATASHGA